MRLSRIWDQSSRPPGTITKSTAVVAVAASTVVLVVLNAPATETAPQSSPSGETTQAGGRAGRPRATAARKIPARARVVAAAWVEDYASTDYRDSSRRPGRRVRRHSTGRLLQRITSDSGARAFNRRARRMKRRTAAEVEAVQVEDGTGSGLAVVVIYSYKTAAATGKSRGLRTITLRLEQLPAGWKVAEVVVP